MNRITDQIGANHLVASTDEEPLAVVMIGGVIANTTIQRNGRLFFRGRWQPSDFNSAWSGTARTSTTSGNTTYVMGNYWGIVSVQEKFNSTNNQHFRFGDGNSYPGIRLVGDATYRYNSTVRPANVDVGDDTWYDAHAVIMDAIQSPAGNTRKTLHGIRLENGANHEDVEVIIALTQQGGLHEGSGMELDFGDYYWSEAAIYDIPDTTVAAQRTQNLENWDAIRNDIANNLTAIIGNRNNNYDLTA